MKAIYAKQLDIILKQEVPKQLPDFHFFKPHVTREQRAASNLEPGDRIFQRTVSNGMLLFLIFSTHPRQEEFNLELVWSTKGRFPIDLERPSVLPEPDNEEMMRDEAVVGFYNLYPRVTGKGHRGWAVWRCSVTIDHPRFREIFVQEDLQQVTEQKVQELVQKAVVDCMSDIKTVALPYFDRLIQAKCSGPHTPLID